ncbi:unnamed protein product [Gadus morhua 'NCC']
MPGRDEADLMFSWDPGSVYRRLVEGLCDRARRAFPMVRDWTALRKVQQQPGETLADLVDRVEQVFKIHGGMPAPTDIPPVVQTPYEESLDAALLDALAKNISEFIQTHCIGWRTARLDLIISYATHAEDLFMNKEMLAQKKDKEASGDEVSASPGATSGMDVPGLAAGPDEAVWAEEDALEFSLDIVRSYPKAGPRKITKRRGRKRTTAILTTPRTLKQRRPAKQPPSSLAPKKRLFSPAPDAAPLAGVTPGATSAAPPTITWPADGVTPTLGPV